MTQPDFQILYEEGPCLIVVKPGGLLTQAPPGIDSIEVRIKRFLKQRENKPGKVYLAVPHRLDRPVSGVMVFAKHVRAGKRISEQFEARTVKKTYWAVVENQVEPDSGQWRDFMRKIPGQAASEVVPEDHPDAREAILNYQVCGRSDAATWLEIQLETGRTHQIRVQAASRGFPIVGDLQYGAATSFGPNSEDQRQRLIALHARTLELNHPMTKEPISATAPLSEHWESLPFSF